MTTQTIRTDRTAPAHPADVLAAAEALRPWLLERSAQIETTRQLPRDVVHRLHGAGILSVLLPTSHGGAGADLPTALDVFTTLSRADASAGWTAMIGACAWADLTALPRAVFDSIIDEGRSVTAGAFNPTGSITPVAGGYRVTGRWSHASGCTHAAWLWGNCVQEMTPEGPRLRIAVFPAEQAVIQDTWHVSGLCGTGSHHFAVEDLFVPAERTFIPLHDPPCLDLPLARVPTPIMFALGIAAVAVGIAAGALDDLQEAVAAKVPMLTRAPLCADPEFQHALAMADADVRAARALLATTVHGVWERAVAGRTPEENTHARDRAAAAWISDRCAAVVDVAYSFGGATVIFTDHPLQRRWRDVHALTQHFLVAPRTFTAAGSVLSGQGVPVPVF